MLKTGMILTAFALIIVLGQIITSQSAWMGQSLLALMLSSLFILLVYFRAQLIRLSETLSSHAMNNVYQRLVFPTHSNKDLLSIQKSYTLLADRLMSSQNKIEQLYRDHEQSLENHRQLAQSMAKELDAQKQRIAGHLHDQFGSMLTSLNYKIQSVLVNDEQACLTLHQQVTELQRITRELIHELYPENIQSVGLCGALKTLAQQFTKENPKINLDYHISPKLSAGELQADIAIAVFRIVQSALNNITQHANAKRVYFNVKRLDYDGPDRVVVKIEDDGIGFNKHNTKGFGLPIMERRATEFNGQLEIDTQPGNGTRIHAYIPINLPPMANTRINA